MLSRIWIVGSVLLGSKQGGEVGGMAVTSQIPVAILAGSDLLTMDGGVAGAPSRQCLQVILQARLQRPGQEGGSRGS